MRRIILGYIFYLLGILFGFSVVGNIFRFLTGSFSKTTIGIIEDLLAILIAGFLAYIFIKYGNKFLKKKPEDNINQIGNNS
ncbi:hypothetical protein [uncultured Lacinutrix sp.]|uniref:hypothetical protein n=1 Tax=uncultured Lacinutrix sp. TaxID=574032 RepID=UPI00262E482A|nr:hypothetical protein [uncultured Lacinutrix sp.]